MPTLWSLQRKIFGQPLGKLFFYEDGGPYPYVRVSFLQKLNQAIIERGWTPPWAISRQECIDFWRAVTNENEAKNLGNKPEDYVNKAPDVVRFVDRFCAGIVSKDDLILELGSNAGGNLRHLADLGYKNLSGVEINPSAVETMRQHLPELAARTPIRIGAFEDVLPGMADRSADLVMTMGVSMHIHPASHAIFEQMVRISRKFICLIEHEMFNCNYVFARDYKRVFERLGCRELKGRVITTEDRSGYDGMTIRLFEVPSHRAALRQQIK